MDGQIYFPSTHSCLLLKIASILTHKQVDMWTVSPPPFVSCFCWDNQPSLLLMLNLSPFLLRKQDWEKPGSMACRKGDKSKIVAYNSGLPWKLEALTTKPLEWEEQGVHLPKDPPPTQTYTHTVTVSLMSGSFVSSFSLCWWLFPSPRLSLRTCALTSAAEWTFLRWTCQMWEILGGRMLKRAGSRRPGIPAKDKHWLVVLLSRGPSEMHTRLCQACDRSWYFCWKD